MMDGEMVRLVSREGRRVVDIGIVGEMLRSGKGAKSQGFWLISPHLRHLAYGDGFVRFLLLFFLFFFLERQVASDFEHPIPIHFPSLRYSKGNKHIHT